MTVVLDASALLAFLKGEPGGEFVGTELPDSTISIVNWAEVLSKMTEYGATPHAVTATLRETGALDDGLTVAPFTRSQAEDVASLISATRRRGLSLGDRACLALARSLDARVLTTDRAWAALDLSIDIHVIR